MLNLQDLPQQTLLRVRGRPDDWRLWAEVWHLNPDDFPFWRDLESSALTYYLVWKENSLKEKNLIRLEKGLLNYSGKPLTQA
ncbi:hypothetical protein Q3V30_09920 [Erwinia pyri]|uniref:Uncharacterized protein n=1 Tax=Erwinia pyri TaxID=3062598 RepID=A0AA50DMM9_9GAMM|nr:hypothetical protein [Erwinia sp. DE2]WLS80764.1 hypothetical protein Q3V30_09920 [Erwinia sp. DE2]